MRINIFREHRQTIQVRGAARRPRRCRAADAGWPASPAWRGPAPQYIQPQDAKVLGQAELVVIDEAAAIPLPHVRALLGPYLVFMASTINGCGGRPHAGARAR